MAQAPSLLLPEFAAETRRSMAWRYFRPWYADARIAFFGPSGQEAANYASILAVTALHSNVESCEPAACDVALDLDGLDEAGDRPARLRALAALDCRSAVGLDAGAGWDYERFQAEVQAAFQGKEVAWLGQSPGWPFQIGPWSPESTRWIAAIGGEPPAWPSLGLAMPTVDSPAEVADAVVGLQRGYPGELRIAIVANGSSPATLELLRTLADGLPNLELLESETNLGYGQGCNRGLERLAEHPLRYLGVVNDDVIPDTDCLPELAAALLALESLGLRPGAIGPVSNRIHGQQQVDIGAFDSVDGMYEAVLDYRRTAAASVTQVRQLRGLLLLFHPDAAREVGGFDPCFGIGNFEDDDHNLRCHLAGYSLWIAEGAYLHHHGSTTFRRMQVDYEANIRRNAEAMAAKWGLETVENWIELNSPPPGASLHVPFSSWHERAQAATVAIGGEPVDLVRQASDIEFAAWVMQALRDRPRAERRKIVDLLAA